jgi:hypothetical protein
MDKKDLSLLIGKNDTKSKLFADIDTSPIF